MSGEQLSISASSISSEMSASSNPHPTVNDQCSRPSFNPLRLQDVMDRPSPQSVSLRCSPMQTRGGPPPALRSANRVTCRCFRSNAHSPMGTLRDPEGPTPPPLGVGGGLAADACSRELASEVSNVAGFALVRVRPGRPAVTKLAHRDAVGSSRAFGEGPERVPPAQKIPASRRQGIP
jgi:hypothetical protein